MNRRFRVVDLRCLFATAALCGLSAAPVIAQFKCGKTTPCVTRRCVAGAGTCMDGSSTFFYASTEYAPANVRSCEPGAPPCTGNVVSGPCEVETRYNGLGCVGQPGCFRISQAWQGCN